MYNYCNKIMTNSTNYYYKIKFALTSFSIHMLNLTRPCGRLTPHDGHQKQHQPLTVKSAILG